MSAKQPLLQRALPLAASSIAKPIPPATIDVAEAPMPAGRTAQPLRPETQRMGNVRIAAAFTDRALVSAWTTCDSPPIWALANILAQLVSGFGTLNVEG